jgi:hypothetical protein
MSPLAERSRSQRMHDVLYGGEKMSGDPFDFAQGLNVG